MLNIIHPMIKTYEIILTLTLISLSLGQPHPIFGNSYACASISPGEPCTSYCTYEITTTRTLNPRCSTYQSNNGNCYTCDNSLFVKVGTYCIPHLMNNEYEHTTYYNFRVTAPTSGKNQLGYSLGTKTQQNTMSQTVSGIPAHYAVRIRFGIYMINNDDTSYIYPLVYTIDTHFFTHDPSKQAYYSCYDIITSPQVPHYNTTLNVTWKNNDSTTPKNYAGCGTAGLGCRCAGGFSGSSCCGCANDPQTCCDDKYIEIRDMIVFYSPCPSDCATCNSQTNCSSCSGGRYLNLADSLCYLTCPQSTYPNTSSYLYGNAASFSYPSYFASYQSVCLPCASNYCLECINSTHCTRCYTLGRNQSYLLNYTCYQNCPFGYFENMTNHTCDCPQDGYFKVQTNFAGINNFSMSCTACSFQCLWCTASTNLDCTKCNPGFYRANGTTFCLNRCPDGQYINTANQLCYLCDVSCSSCQGQPQNCTACHTNTQRYLLGNVCLTWCPNGYEWNNITMKCIMCDYYTYSYQGQCLSTCPDMYEANSYNRSCLYVGNAGTVYGLVLEEVHVLSHGKLLQFVVLVQDGLNSTSQTWLKLNSYYSAQVIYRDSRLETFQGIRSLGNVSLSIRNINYSNNRITYTTNLPNGGMLDYHKSFQVIFGTVLYSSQNITYQQNSGIYSINQHPELMKQYYSYVSRKNFDLFAIPFLIMIAFLFLVQVKGVYSLYIEAYRMVQVLGLLIYTAYPIGPYAYYFLVGCSYCNLDFITNIYALLAKSDTQKVFASYYFSTSDMDFVRFMGSIMVFGVFMLFVYLICRFLIGVKQSRLDFLIRLSIDLMEVKVFHSFWSSLLYIIVNYQATEFNMFIVFILAVVFVSGLVGRRFSIWREVNDFSPFFLWRASVTLAICFVSFANEIVLTVIVLMSILVTFWQLWLLHSDAYLIKVNDLNSSNYMDERTYHVLNAHDVEVPYSFTISLRNMLATSCPFLTALLLGIMVLLRDAELYSIIFTVAIIYTIFILVCITTIFVYKFLSERRKYLVQNKLEYLQKKYAKLGASEDHLYEQRKRPRVSARTYDTEAVVNRNMMKTFD